MAIISVRPQTGNTGFEVPAGPFASEKGLPGAAVLPPVEIERIFRRHGGLFGETYNAVYTTAVVLWAFLSQVMADGKMRSCTAAVARVRDFMRQAGRPLPSPDTGEYCNARRKLNEKALHELMVEAARKIEYVAAGDWLWHGRHVKLVDGFTATMPDTPENQKEFPQPKSQRAGVGFPIMRVCVILSLATACVLDAAFGPYSGKQTGEPALFRQLLDTFQPGDVALFDRYYCSYMMLALLNLRGVDTCARLHQRRACDFRRENRLGEYDRLVSWQRPARPAWMDETTYAEIPETLTLRMIRFNITAPGRRTQVITVVTSLLDPDQYSAGVIAAPVRLPVECGARYPADQAGAESAPPAVQDAGNGPEGILDDAVGLQPHSADRLYGGDGAREDASADQLHADVFDDSGGLVELLAWPLWAGNAGKLAGRDCLAGFSNCKRATAPAYPAPWHTAGGG